MNTRPLSILSFGKEDYSDDSTFSDTQDIIQSLPTTIIKPLRRTKSILRSSVQLKSNEELINDGNEDSPAAAADDDEKSLHEIQNRKKTVRFASHVQIQHTPTLYPRKNLPLPYQLVFWKKNRFVHILGIFFFLVLILTQLSMVGAFWPATCTRPLQYIVTSNACITFLFIIAIVLYSSALFIKAKLDSNRRRKIRKKTIEQLNSLRETTLSKLQNGDSKEHFSNTKLHTDIGHIIDEIPITKRDLFKEPSPLPTTNVLPFEKDESSAIEDIHTSFRIGSPNMDVFLGNLLEGITRVVSESDSENEVDSSRSSQVSNSVEIPLVSSLRTKVVEACLEEDFPKDETPIDDKLNTPSDAHYGNTQTQIQTTSEATQIEYNNQTNNNLTNIQEKTIPIDGNFDNQQNLNISENTKGVETTNTLRKYSNRYTTSESSSSGSKSPKRFKSFLTPTRSSHYRRGLKNRKFRDSIVINKNLKRRFETEVIESNVGIPAQSVQIDSIPKITIFEDPTQSYSLISQSIQQIENGTLMLEPLNDIEETRIITPASCISLLIRKHLFGIVFVLVWLIPHLWAIVSLVFIIDYGNCPYQSLGLYIANILYFTFIVIVTLLELTVVILSFK